MYPIAQVCPEFCILQPLHFVATCTNTLWLAKSIVENPSPDRSQLTSALGMLRHLVIGPSLETLERMNQV